MHFVDLAIGDSGQPDAGKVERFVEPGDIREAAREPVEILAENHIVLPGERQVDQALIIRPSGDRRAGGGVIGEDVGDGETVPRGMRPAERDLVFNRAVVLKIVRESSVDRCAYVIPPSPGPGRPAADRDAPPRAHGLRSAGRARDQALREPGQRRGHLAGLPADRAIRQLEQHVSMAGLSGSACAGQVAPAQQRQPGCEALRVAARSGAGRCERARSPWRTARPLPAH